MINQTTELHGMATGAQGQGENAAGQGKQNPGPTPFISPSISLPKGGGAIRGIGETFAANPVTGTGSLAVPIYTSASRSGVSPQLSLSYDSGAGNGPFGFGWRLSTPEITRKTDKGLPRYEDARESDVFILSGAEDLLPVLHENNDQWERRSIDRSINGKDYKVEQYRPRVEGLFARIERWTNASEPDDTFWRSISKENITTWYGKSDGSRICDPSDPARIFTWLICESYDDRGNAIFYEYKAEDSTGVDCSQAHERNRTEVSRSANRYLKSIKYCNQTPRQEDEALSQRSDWLFEVVFDYGEHDPDKPKPGDAGAWLCRHDPFSSYRSGFEVRAYRLCQRILMFHHFPEEQGVGRDCLVRSTDFVYRNLRNNPEDLRKGHPIASFIATLRQSGYKLQPDGGYHKKSLPPLEFEYSQALLDEEVREIEQQSLENLPTGLDGAQYEWIDLDGEGISGILSRRPEGWFYKRNLSPLTVKRQNGHETMAARFAPAELIARQPSLADGSGRQQFLDLAGDGQLDFAQFSQPLPGFYERTQDSNWAPFTSFESIPNLAWDDSDLKFVDLTGDGHADMLIPEDNAFTWYPSLAEAGFGPAERALLSTDEEKGPRLIFADSARSIYLADISGDGLADLVRISNGEVCYWPNLGYGRFGAKVTMDNAPRFDSQDLFDQKRIRLADIDGSGLTDIIYLHSDGVRLYFNQAGNGWSAAQGTKVFPQIDSLSSVTVADLLSAGTACLVWSSLLPGDARRQMRYVDLMGGQKPHLLISSKNNLGAETHVRYASSTKFYLQDKYDGKPWVTRLPFPVHVVEQVETVDRISGNRFITRYAYHHGYFDGVEREFRGFGMVEQYDTAEMAALTAGGALPEATNLEPASHVPPVLTRTWFHTGAFFDGRRISKHFEHEYYREGDAGDNLAGLSDEQLQAQSLEDTLLPSALRRADGTRLPYSLSADEAREACRALKGSVLRQEVYALDDADEADRPYSVSERNYAIELLQPRAGAKYAVFFTHAREQRDFHYERKLASVNGEKIADPRVSHGMTIEVDDFGNALRTLAIGYRRRELPGVDAPEQKETHITLTINRFANQTDAADLYRVGLPVETCAYEVVKPPDPQIAQARIIPFSFESMESLAGDLIPTNSAEPPVVKLWPYEKWDWRANRANAPSDTRLRLIERVRTRYRKDNLTGLLPLGVVESLALPGESYKLALTPGLISSVFKREQGAQVEDLLPNPAPLLEAKGADEGGFAQFDGAWWIPSGRVFFDPAANTADPSLTAAQELATARQHFFLGRKFTDPFGQSARVDYDDYHFLVINAQDALGNTVESDNDYRVMQPRLVTDPNLNRTAAEFDALGMVVATAVMGKDSQNLGDLLEGFDADPPLNNLQAFVADPYINAASHLGKATTRIVYDLDRFDRCGQPPFAATLARETHFTEPGGAQSKIQISFSYSDGFGREIQKKVQAEPGDAPQRGADVTAPSGDLKPGNLVRGDDGKPVEAPAAQRWVGTGRTVFNNKGKPVRQYEPFFSSTNLYEEEREMTDTGVSPVIFYDPVGRVIATLHPNQTYEKVVFDPWQQSTYDVNDTVTLDPRTDVDVAGYVAAYFATQPASWQTWYAQRIGNQLGAAEHDAALKAAAHANTPAVAHFDTLGRTFLAIADNGVDQNNAPQKYATRVVFDIEGNQRAVIDAKDRIVMRYDYDLLGAPIHQASIEAGERWILNDVTGKPVRVWDSRRFIRRMTYDGLRRPVGLFVTENGTERLAERTVYGEGVGAANNHRTRVHQVYDGAGVVTSEAYDFKGNLLQSKRELLPNYKQVVDWRQNPLPNDGAFSGSASYDALNRPKTVTTPDNSVYCPIFNEANLLDRVGVNLRGAATTTAFVTNINYNAKGQRELIVYGNGAQTAYDYDPLTFRLAKLTTTRPANPDATASQLFNSITKIQDLRYTYDPVGNITRIEDLALKTIFNNNEQVEPVCSYAYDAIYRLIEAHGREHIGQTALDFNPPSLARRDLPFFGLRANSNDLQAMRNYTERYEYDEVGNFAFLRHLANGGNWTRSYDYEEASLIEPATRKNNRLTRARANGQTETYSYIDALGGDTHGCMTAINAMTMVWDFKDQLRQVDLGGGGTAYYVYDSRGQRVRKVIETQNGARKRQRIYVGGFELYREYESDGATVKLEREALHVMDDKLRIAIVETRAQGDDDSPAQLTRHQLGNHLGSASLELAEDGALISYEEYHPYGTTAFQAGRAAEVSLKRYRYTGKERDEESGLYYHGARYYAPWLGRWTSADPIGIKASINAYEYVSNAPITKYDPDGMWEADMHFIATYWAGRMQGANHVQAMIAAIGNQSLDDSDKKAAPSLKLTLDEKNIQLANNSHSLNLTRSESRKVALMGIGEQNVLLFGLGLHTVGDFLPHANLSGKASGGHQVGYNEDFSHSADVFHDADVTYKNPRKALATFESFRELWSQYLSKGGEYKKLKDGDPNLALISKFIFTKYDDYGGKVDALTKGLKAIGVSDEDLADVMKYYKSPFMRRNAMMVMWGTEKGNHAIKTANNVWRSQKDNNSFFNSTSVDITQDVKGVAQITTEEFEQRRAANLARVKQAYNQVCVNDPIACQSIPQPREGTYSPR